MRIYSLIPDSDKIDMLGSTVKDLAGSLAARVAGGKSASAADVKVALAAGGEAAAEGAGLKGLKVKSTGQTSSEAAVHSPEVDALIFEVRPVENIDPELLRAQIKAIVVPRAQIGEVRIQLDEPFKGGRALLTVAVQVTDPGDQTLEKVRRGAPRA